MTIKDARTASAFKVRPNALVSTDDSEMYAEFNASVPEVDREDEVIVPTDYVTEWWESNPVWLWAHDKEKHPIGAGYKADGSVACRKTKEALIHGCRFSHANPQGVMTYALYKEGTLKMVSVGFIATRGDKVNGSEWGVNRIVTRIMDPELIECSCVPIGMNRNAMLTSIKGMGKENGYIDRVKLASVLDNGHLNGEKMPEDMAHDLAAFAEPKRFKAAAFFSKSTPSNKISTWASRSYPNKLRLNHSFGSPFMASIAKAPLTAGTIPGKTNDKPATEPEVKTETVLGEKAVKTVETKADDNASTPTAKLSGSRTGKRQWITSRAAARA